MTLNILRPAGLYGPGSVLEVPTYRRILKQRWSLAFAGGIEVHPTHATDVARAILALVKRPAPHATVFNIGGERRIPLGELHRLIAASLGVSPRTIVVPRSAAPIARAAMPLFAIAGHPKPQLASMIEGRWLSSAVDDARFRRAYPNIEVINLEKGVREHVQWARAQGLL